jgi:hypothetical protein
MQMALHASGAQLHRHHRPNDFLAAAAAKRLPWLHRGAASIAEHIFLPRSSLKQCRATAIATLSTTQPSTDGTYFAGQSSIVIARTLLESHLAHEQKRKGRPATGRPSLFKGE